MASVNEYSTRYSVAIDACQKTKPNEWRTQSKGNRQGSNDYLCNIPGNELTVIELSEEEGKLQKLSREIYEKRLAVGVAREQARKDLCLSTYTEAYWKIDGKNLIFGFLGLRQDNHAQKEIRDFANIIGEDIVAKWVPLAWEAYNDYHPLRGGMNLTRLEIEIINAVATNNPEFLPTNALLKAKTFGWLNLKGGKLRRNRERSECQEKLKKLGLPIPWKHRLAMNYLREKEENEI